jgi:hypothetical protein
MSVLVYLAKRDIKQQVMQIMQLDNSDSFEDYFSYMEDGVESDLVSSCSSFSTKTSFLLYPNSGLDGIVVSQDSHFLMTPISLCSILLSQLLQFAQ